MTGKLYDLIGIGNAIVDVLSYQDASFLEENNLTKGAMTLIDEATAKKLYKVMNNPTECAGGSAANTLAGFAMLGGFAAFVGRVRDDDLGQTFRDSLEKSNVDFLAPSATNGATTAKCMVFVTEDKNRFGENAKVERTMATYLGAAGEISENDINEEDIKNCKAIFFEGYLWDNEMARKAIQKAVTLAKLHEKKVAFTLSDPLCVDRHRDAFHNLVENYVDILFCNTPEIEALYGDKDIRKIFLKLSKYCEVSAVTRSELGSYVMMEDSMYHITAEKVDMVYDVTGAGDLYAAGFLYGYLNGLGPEVSGRLASLCAAEVIKYLGARPLTNLFDLIEKAKEEV